METIELLRAACNEFQSLSNLAKSKDDLKSAANFNETYVKNLTALEKIERERGQPCTAKLLSNLYSNCIVECAIAFGELLPEGSIDLDTLRYWLLRRVTQRLRKTEAVDMGWTGADLAEVEGNLQAFPESNTVDLSIAPEELRLQC